MQFDAADPGVAGGGFRTMHETIQRMYHQHKYEVRSVPCPLSARSLPLPALVLMPPSPSPSLSPLLKLALLAVAACSCVLLCAAALQMPNIVFWNLRANSISFPAAADTPGVAMVSGFSSDLMTLFLDCANLSPALLLERALAPYADVEIDPEEHAQR